MRNLDTTLTKWGGEARLSLLPEFHSSLEYRSYELSKTPQIENGGLEFEIILNKMPIRNVFAIPIETNRLRFAYQSHRIGPNCFRPENVKGSYAVFHESKRGDYTRLGGKNYMAGKAFHVFRPKAIDSLGRTSWGALRVDEKRGLLIVSMPWAFLESAKYPVVIDPTFGDIGVGGSTGTAPATGEITAQKYALSETGTATAICAYIWAPTTGMYAQYGIYDDASPRARKAYTGNSTEIGNGVGNVGWISANIAAALEMAPGNYWIGMNLSEYYVTCYFDSDAGQNNEYVAQTYNSWAATINAPWTGEAGGCSFSMYATYDVAGGADVEVALTGVSG